MFRTVKNLCLTALLGLAALLNACGGGADGSSNDGSDGAAATPPTTQSSLSVMVPNGAISAGALRRLKRAAVLSWTAPTQDTDGNALSDLSGYRIYYGTSATALNQTAVASGAATRTYTVGNLTAGTWYFAMTSVSGTGTSAVESDRTGAVSKVIP